MNQAVVRMSEVVTFVKEFITINDHQDYKRCRVKLHRQGIVLRDVIKGNQIKTKKQQVCKAGQFLVAEIDAKVGGYGIVPLELEGAIVSSHYYLFNVNRDRICLEYLEYYLKTDDFFNQIKPQGSTNYAAIRPNDVLNMIIPLPSIPEQLEIVSRLKYTFESLHSLNIRMNNNDQHITELRQAILQEAVQGKLAPQDPSDEPASVLLDKIRVEKERLIKEKKIKKEKPLPPISEGEIPYDLPQGWEWVRLGELGEINPRNFCEDELEVSFAPMALIPEKYSGTVIFEKKKWKDIKSGFTHFAENDVVIAKITPCFQNGKSAVMQNLVNKFGAGTTELHVFRGNPNFIAPKYVFVIFKNNAFIKNGESKMTGTAGQQRVPKDYVSNVLIPLPPIKEQKRIVDKVDQLMAFCDELEKTVILSKQESELLMQSVLQEAFRKPEKANNIVELPTSVSQEAGEEWDMVARAEGISPETQAEIAATLEEIKRERQ